MRRRNTSRRGGDTRASGEGGGAEAASDILAPTDERKTQGETEHLDRPIEDAHGQIARPWRAVDLLSAMERRGAITDGMRKAGEMFRIQFNIASLHGVQAMDLTRPLVSGGSYRHQPARSRTEDARADVWRALAAVGGYNSPGGSCLWYVVGWELPLKQWAQQRGWSGRKVSWEAASGILIAALGALEAFFDGEGN